MVDDIIRKTSKKTWYKWSLYMNIILFLIVAAFIAQLTIDSINYGHGKEDLWLAVTRDIAFISVAVSLIFVQFIRNLFIIMRRSL